jgi:Cof subfamily protein (haloacid dehalogenase superfamily)
VTRRLPRVVATDLDGTIVRTDGTVSERTAAALAAVEKAGALVVLVTGRPPRWVHQVAEAIGHTGLAICANGALVYDLHTEKVVEEHLLAPEVGREVVRVLREALPGATFAVERTEGFAFTSEYRPRLPPPPDAVAAELEGLFAEPTAKLLVRHEDYDADGLLQAARAVVGDLATLTHSSLDGLLEISASGVSKASTLELVCAERGVEAADVLAFGDMPNDLPMLVWAGRGVAVANAHPSVLEAVTEVTASNDDDGVAQVLEVLLRPD